MCLIHSLCAASGELIKPGKITVIKVLRLKFMRDIHVLLKYQLKRIVKTQYCRQRRKGLC